MLSSPLLLGFDEIERLIAERDAKDRSRKSAPLLRAEDQHYVDTSALAFEDVVSEVKRIVAERLRADRRS